MVFNTADNDGLTFELGQNAAEVAMQLLAQCAVAQEWAAVFGGEHGVNQDFRKGLRHGGRMGERTARFNPFRVDAVCVTPSRWLGVGYSSGMLCFRQVATISSGQRLA